MSKNILFAGLASAAFIATALVSVEPSHAQRFVRGGVRANSTSNVTPRSSSNTSSAGASGSAGGTGFASSQSEAAAGSLALPGVALGGATANQTSTSGTEVGRAGILTVTGAAPGGGVGLGGSAADGTGTGRFITNSGFNANSGATLTTGTGTAGGSAGFSR